MNAVEPLGRILLVEDSPQDAEMVIDALSDYNLANEIIHLRDGAEALDYLFRRGRYEDRVTADPAVILLDLKMPKVDGLEVLRQMRAAPALALIPVVVMTSSQAERDLTRSYQLGVNAYVVKPVHFGDFAEAVRQTGRFWAILNQAPPQRASSAEA